MPPLPELGYVRWSEVQYRSARRIPDISDAMTIPTVASALGIARSTSVFRTIL